MHRDRVNDVCANGEELIKKVQSSIVNKNGAFQRSDIFIVLIKNNIL